MSGTLALENAEQANHPMRQRAPPAMTVAFSKDDPVPARNYKVIQNMAGIEISELKDALAYAEFQLAKTN